MDAKTLAPKKGKYTFLYTDIYFFRLFPQFKIKKNLFSSKKIYLTILKHKKPVLCRDFNLLDDHQM